MCKVSPYSFLHSLSMLKIKNETYFKHAMGFKANLDKNLIKYFNKFVNLVIVYKNLK